MEQREAEMTLIRLGWGQDNPAFRQMWTSFFFPEGGPDELSWFNELQRVSVSPEMAVRIFTELGEIDVRELLPRLNVPTLVLHCRGDEVVPFEEGRRLASLIPGSRFVPLEGRNHIPLRNESAFAELLSETRQFLGRRAVTADPLLIKTCSKCGNRYDESVNYCLDDGSRLSLVSDLRQRETDESASEPTRILGSADGP
jgi:hypothetical protein